ncbi:MAG: hypothetical protein IKI75_08445 [Lachnospiraceae bacterium]|nr:hypothetical protein [Lachnospiraceae bacterium]
MKGPGKGEYGYIRAQLKREALKASLCFLISFALLFTGMIIAKYRNPDISWSKSRNNLLTVAAVLGILPGTRFLIQAIMFAKAKKTACPEELFLRCKETGAALLYDLFFTEYKINHPVYAMAVNDNEVFGLGCGEVSKCEEHLREVLKKDGHKNVTVKLFTDEDKFLDRLQNDRGKRTERADALMSSVLSVSL